MSRTGYLPNRYNQGLPAVPIKWDAVPAIQFPLKQNAGEFLFCFFRHRRIQYYENHAQSRNCPSEYLSQWVTSWVKALELQPTPAYDLWKMLKKFLLLSHCQISLYHTDYCSNITSVQFMRIHFMYFVCICCMFDMELSTTSHSTPCVHYEGYLYIVKRTNEDGTFIWRCSKQW